MLILMLLEGTGDVLLLWVCFVWIWWGSSVLVFPIWIDPGRGNAIHHKLGWIGMGLRFIHLPLQFIQLVPAMKCCRIYHMIFLQFLEGFGGLCGAPPWWSQKSYKMNTFTNRLLKGKIWRWFSNSKMLIYVDCAGSRVFLSRHIGFEWTGCGRCAEEISSWGGSKRAGFEVRLREQVVWNGNFTSTPFAPFVSFYLQWGPT